MPCALQRSAGGRDGPAVMLGYFEDGPNLVTMAMNGWGDAEPAWWLNLQAHPDATADTRRRSPPGHRPGGTRRRARAPVDPMATDDKHLDAYAARRSMQTAVVVLEPRRQSQEEVGDPARTQG